MEIVAATLPVVPDARISGNTAQNRELARAVRTLNGDGAAGTGREFSFSLDPKSRVPVVRIIDSGTGEVIDQIPSEYLLQVAQQLEELRSKSE